MVLLVAEATLPLGRVVRHGMHLHMFLVDGDVGAVGAVIHALGIGL